MALRRGARFALRGVGLRRRSLRHKALSEKAALQALKASNWHLEGAFDVFYSQTQVKPYADTRRVEELYNRYKDPYVDMILVDGITLLCNDLQVDPQDIVMLVLSWHMKAATMCEFSKDEFIGGLQALGIDSLEKLRDRIQLMRSELKDEQKFREIYGFAFGWAKEKGQKSLALDTAIGMWQLLFEAKHWPLVDHWCQFLQSNIYVEFSGLLGTQFRPGIIKQSLGTPGLSYWNLLGSSEYFEKFNEFRMGKVWGLRDGLVLGPVPTWRVSLVASLEAEKCCDGKQDDLPIHANKEGDLPYELSGPKS
ncbi:hypothetical protein RHGRI_018909 [Rhododendron griersonianum]|uniref:Defective in cullin neddylation protein n=1 Tax=Rhododendron griersonianum TaxID=479676 RepID=A0AAV6K3F7_9ERIC|nr:hypothetical protein RHGRI_018909 [Rhododendron griersonianum]